PAEPIDAIVDRLGLDRVDLVKLDIEGHELPALRGAGKTLARFEPTVVAEMNFFTITTFANTLPADFIAEVRALFPFVYDYSPGVGLFAIDDDHAIYKSVQRQFVNGRPSDLICRFERLAPAIEEEVSRRAVGAAGFDPNVAEAQLSGLREQVVTMQNELHAREGEAAALRASTSWRITAPMRWASDVMHRRRSR
ncbi:MAG TPA: FkbM family methyltransferase, partial [Acidimicrobiia bacterium]|nr:FkbM family methyltransferase [Acidimicrobiia bacterium]